MSLREKSRLTTMIMLAGAALGTIGAYINLTVTLLGVALLFGGLWLHLRNRLWHNLGLHLLLP